MSTAESSRSTMPRPAALALHASAVALMSYGYSHLSFLPADEWISRQKGGHWQYLTILAYVPCHSRQFSLTTSYPQSSLRVDHHAPQRRSGPLPDVHECVSRPSRATP